MSESNASSIDATWRAGLLAYLRALSPYEFEHYVAEIYRAEGYEAEVTAKSGDGGRDILIEREGWRWVVECKRYDSSTAVGRRDIQVLHSVVVSERANGGIVVTTGRFTEDARHYATENGVRLIGPRQLARMHRRAYGEEIEAPLVRRPRAGSPPARPPSRIATRGPWIGGDHISAPESMDRIVWSSDGTTFVAGGEEGGVWVRLEASGEVEAMRPVPGDRYALSGSGRRVAVADRRAAQVFEWGHDDVLFEARADCEAEIVYEFYEDVVFRANPYGPEQAYALGPVALDRAGAALLVGRTEGIDEYLEYSADRMCEGTFELFAVDAAPLTPKGDRWVQGVDRWIAQGEAEEGMKDIVSLLNTPCARWGTDNRSVWLRHDGRVGVIVEPRVATLHQSTDVAISNGCGWIGMAGVSDDDTWDGFYNRLVEEWGDDDDGFWRALSRPTAVVVAPLNGRQPHAVETGGEEITTFAFSFDDRYVAVGLGDGSVLLWELRVATPRWRVEVGGPVVSFGFHGGAVYASDQGGRVTCFGTDAGTVTASWAEPGVDVEMAALSPDAQRMVTAHTDGRLRIWTHP